MKHLNLTTSFFLVIFLSSVQFLDISFFGVKPNFAIIAISLIAVIAGSFLNKLFCIALSAMILKFSPDFNVEIAVFFMMGILIVVVAKYLPWNRLVNNLFLIFIYTIGLYLFLMPLKIISAVFFQEMIYNLILGGLISLLLDKFYVNNI